MIRALVRLLVLIASGTAHGASWTVSVDQCVFDFKPRGD